MEHVCSSRNDDCHFINTNHDLNSSHEDEHPLFLNFPSPFFDDISTIPILENNHTHQYHLSSPNKPLNTAGSSPPTESKRTKKRSVGKKDRHSKINTAQGLRDRRMRLSLHIARKFFNLQDLLGFDKASKTIEWLFCKSNKAIKEVADNFNPQQTNQSVCEEIKRMDSLLTSEIKAATSKLDSTKEEEIKNREYSRKQIQNNLSVKEMRDLARARARDRTQERLIIKELEKSKHLFGANPNDEIYRFGLSCLASPNNHDVEELGYTSSSSKPIQQEPSSLSFEHSSTHHLLQELQSATINVNGFNNYSETIVGASTYCSTLINHNRPAGWLNYNNRFSGMPGDMDAGSFITEHCNYGIVPSPGHPTGDIYEQNSSSFLLSSTTNIMHFQSQNQGN